MGSNDRHGLSELWHGGLDRPVAHRIGLVLELSGFAHVREVSNVIDLEKSGRKSRRGWSGARSLSGTYVSRVASDFPPQGGGGRRHLLRSRHTPADPARKRAGWSGAARQRDC
jgi:hypothetical protein